MAIKPAPFSGPMVCAILEGRKTQTRRILKPQPQYLTSGGRKRVYSDEVFKKKRWKEESDDDLPYSPGDLLWVREAWQALPEYDHLKPSEIPVGSDIIHTASRPDAPWDSRKRPGMFMCRWMSRITLEVTDSKVEHIQDISTLDAMAEGVPQTWADFRGNAPKWALREEEDDDCYYDNRTSRENFSNLWNSINGPDAWDRNDWVAAYTFEPIFKNVDEVVG